MLVKAKNSIAMLTNTDPKRGVVALDKQSAAQDYERRGRADEQCVGVDAERLYESLFDRVGDGCRSGGVGRGAFAGLVAEQSALDAQSQSHTDRSARGLVEAECIFYDQAKYLRYAAYVDDDDHKGQRHIGHGHNRHHELAEARDAADPSEYDGQSHNGQQDARQLARNGEAFIEGARDGIGLHGIEREAECQDEKHGKCHGPPPAADPFGYVVGRPSAKGAFATDLIELCERRLYEGARRSEQSYHPHPEYGSRAAESYRRGHSGKVAGAYTRGYGYGKGLKRADRRVIAAMMGAGGPSAGAYELPEHFADHAELYSPRGHGEI